MEQPQKRFRSELDITDAISTLKRYAGMEQYQKMKDVAQKIKTQRERFIEFFERLPWNDDVVHAFAGSPSMEFPKVRLALASVGVAAGTRPDLFRHVLQPGDMIYMDEVEDSLSRVKTSDTFIMLRDMGALPKFGDVHEALSFLSWGAPWYADVINDVVPTTISVVHEDYYVERHYYRPWKLIPRLQQDDTTGRVFTFAMCILKVWPGFIRKESMKEVEDCLVNMKAHVVGDSYTTIVARNPWIDRFLSPETTRTFESPSNFWNAVVFAIRWCTSNVDTWIANKQPVVDPHCVWLKDNMVLKNEDEGYDLVPQAAVRFPVLQPLLEMVIGANITLDELRDLILHATYDAAAKHCVDLYVKHYNVYHLYGRDNMTFGITVVCGMWKYSQHCYSPVTFVALKYICTTFEDLLRTMDIRVVVYHVEGAIICAQHKIKFNLLQDKFSVLESMMLDTLCDYKCDPSAVTMRISPTMLGDADTYE